MNLKDIPSSSEVFIDANIFIYHFTGTSEECTYFLSQCESGRYRAITAANILLEVLHRLMMIEIVQKRFLSPPNLLRKLEKKTAIISQLNEYYLSTLAIFDMGVTVLPLFPEIIKSSQIMRSRHGLMVNDSLIAALMREKGLQHMASNDEAFSRIDWIQYYKPSDVA